MTFLYQLAAVPRAVARWEWMLAPHQGLRGWDEARTADWIGPSRSCQKK